MECCRLEIAVDDATRQVRVRVFSLFDAAVAVFSLPFGDGRLRLIMLRVYSVVPRRAADNDVDAIRGLVLYEHATELGSWRRAIVDRVGLFDWLGDLLGAEPFDIFENTNERALSDDDNSDKDEPDIDVIGIAITVNNGVDIAAAASTASRS